MAAGAAHGDVETALKRILALEVHTATITVTSQTDVKGLLLIDQDGNVLRNTMPEEHATKYAQEIPALSVMVRSAVREIEPKDALQMMRIKSRKHEMMIIVEEKFTLMVIQEYPGFWVEPPPPPPTPPRDSDDEFYDDDDGDDKK